MMKIFLVLVLLTLSAFTVEGFFTPFRFFNRGPPPFQIAKDANMRAINTSYVTQKLDNFNPDPLNRTYNMRYITNDQFFKEGGPIFIMLGGEWTINIGFVIGGHMYEIGKDVNAFLMHTEHRYYGLSKPTPNTTAENLKYLNVDQSLRDVVELVKILKSTDRFAKSKVVVFGGSYSGNMATWIRLKYPDVIDGAMASSGPVQAKSDFYEYLETVSDSMLAHGGLTCWETIRDGVKETEDLLKTENGTSRVTALFKLCSKLNTSEPLDVQTFFSAITESYSGLVQYGTPYTIKNACNSMAAGGPTPIEKLAKYVTSNFGSNCLDVEYSSLVDSYGNTSYNGDEGVITGRLWFYQTCNEYGYYQTTTSKKQPFGQNLPLSYFTEHFCPDLYGPEFGTESVNDGVEQVNQVYGSLNPNVTNVFSIHGNIDPWHRLGIVNDLSDNSPAILINGTSHCADLQGSSLSDSTEMKYAREQARKYITSWVQ